MLSTRNVSPKLSDLKFSTSKDSPLQHKQMTKMNELEEEELKKLNLDQDHNDKIENTE